MSDLKKPDCCPKCGKDNIKQIIGGTPNREDMALISSGLAVCGDCFMKEWKEDWHCANCKYNWCDKNDPERIKLENLYLKIKNKYNL